MNHVTMMTASAGSNQHARAAWGWEKSGKAWSSSCLNTSTSCTKLRLCSFSEFFYRFLVGFCTARFGHMSGLGRRQCQRIVNKKCKCFLVVAFLNKLIFSKNVVAPTQLVNLDLCTSYRRRESSSAWVETWFSCKVEKRTPEHGWAAITFQAAALPCSGHAAFSLIEIPFGHREFCYSCHVVDALEGMWSSKLHGNWLDL